MQGDGSPGPLSALGRKLHAAATALARTAQSAGELLSDRDLRKKAAAFVMNEANKVILRLHCGGRRTPVESQCSCPFSILS